LIDFFLCSLLLLLCSRDSFFLFLFFVCSSFCDLFSSFGVGSLHLGGGLCLLDRPSHDGGLWPLHCHPVCEGVELQAAADTFVFLCATLSGSSSTPRRRAAEEPLIGQRGRKPWQQQMERGDEDAVQSGWLDHDWAGLNGGWSKSGHAPHAEMQQVLPCKVPVHIHEGKKLFVSEWLVGIFC
jgi:hypothetical protein